MLGTMILGAVTTAAYAWLAGPLVGALFDAARGNRAEPARIPGLGSADTVVDVAMILAAGLVAISIVRGVAGFAQTLWLARLQLAVVRDLRIVVYEHLLRIVPSALVSQSRGELGQRVAGDVQQVEGLINIAIAPLVRNLATSVALLVLAFRLDPVLAGVSVLGIPPVIWVVSRFAGRTRSAWRASWDAQAKIAGDVTEVAGMVAVVRAFEAEAATVRAFEERADAAHRTATRARLVSAALAPLLSLLGAVAVAGTAVLGTLRLVDGDLAAETYVSFFAALFLMYRPIQGLGMTVGRFAGGLAALDRVSEVLDLERERQDTADAVDIPPLRERLCVEGVRFSYGAREVLRGLSLTITRGESVAIVGASGEGKTTLLLVLLGILEPDEGRIRIDGQDLRGATRAALRRQFAWVPQEPLLFADTILANIALGDPAPDGPRAVRAARRAGASAFLEALPAGLDTVLAEGGANLSVGQRQRICIARALYREAPILLLDEPTASLDGEAEDALGRTIEELLVERTVILVSHRESTVRRADRMVVLREGRVVSDGAPDEVWAAGSQVGAIPPSPI